MGHVRLGRLPKTLSWRKVSALLADSPDLVPLIASSTVIAAEDELNKDPSRRHPCPPRAPFLRRSQRASALADTNCLPGPRGVSYIPRASGIRP